MIEYKVRVWIDTKAGDITYQKSTYRIKNTELEEAYVDIKAFSEATLHTDSWENDMVDSVLDGFKGTNMKIINRIEY